MKDLKKQKNESQNMMLTEKTPVRRNPHPSHFSIPKERKAADFLNNNLAKLETEVALFQFALKEIKDIKF